MQLDGKIVVAGGTETGGGGSSDFALARYNTDGTLDASFGTGGIVTTAFGAGADVARAVALQGDGKIVAAGFTHGLTRNFAVARYNANGTLDATFHNDGRATTPVGIGADEARAVAIQTDGKIVAAGFATSGHESFAVARYEPNGSLDTSFSVDGKTTTSIGAASDRGRAVAIQSDGMIVVAGSSDGDVALVRYATDGALDTDFDSDGKVTTSLGSGPARANALAIATGGKLVVAGSSFNGADNDFVVARYEPDGSLDATFDSDGARSTAIGPSEDNARAVAIQSNGKIVVVGDALDALLRPDFALARYEPDGSLDTTFATDGKTTTTRSTLDIARAVALDTTGKIVIAGTSLIGTTGAVALARYQPAPPPNPPTALTTTRGDGELAVSWTAPVSNGGDPISSYRATASPGGRTCSTSGTSCAIGGLANGTTYAVSVEATNSIGTSTPSAPSSLTPNSCVTPAGARLVATVDLADGEAPTQGPDVITGTNGDDTVDSLGGDDVVCTGGGSDTVTGGAGNDLIDAGEGDDTVGGGPGDDIIAGGPGEDTLSGDEGIDLISADDLAASDSGRDIVNGGGGGDTIYGLGADLIAGDAGDDAIFARAAAVPCSVARGVLGLHVHPGAAAAGTSAADVSAIWGTHFLAAGATAAATASDNPRRVKAGIGNDTIVGSGILKGGPGRDSLAGCDRRDTLAGGDGHDVLVGGGGRDVLDGGAGDDMLIGNGGNDELVGRSGNDALRGDAGNDIISGGDGRDLILGGTKRDVLDGGRRGDLILGGNGKDSLTGGGGRDTLYGGNGNDTLRGGPGADMVSGGRGRDRLPARDATPPRDPNPLIARFATRHPAFENREPLGTTWRCRLVAGQRRPAALCG